MVTGNLLSINTEEVEVDPEGAVSLLRLNSTSIASLSLAKTGETFNYPISQEIVSSILNVTDNKKSLRTNTNSSYFQHYWGAYFFGGVSSKKTILSDASSFAVDRIHLVYRNNAVFGGGAEYFYDTRNNPVDLLIDAEIALIGAEFLMKTEGIEQSIMTGTVVATDINLNVFPFQLKGGNYPAPFAFVGLGFRFIDFEDASEIHAALPFGLGVRYYVTERMAIQLKQKFVYSKLDGVDNFILPETRIEIHFDISKW